jgi:hypothetical protein
MDLVVPVVILAAATAAVRAVARVGASNGPFSLGDLFRTSHDLGWPVGVQEDDGPVGWGAKVSAFSAQGECESARDSMDADVPREIEAPSVESVDPAGRQAWRSVLRGGSMSPGTARR